MMNVQRGKQASMKSFTSANTLFLLVPEGMYTGSSKKDNVLTIRPSCIFYHIFYFRFFLGGGGGVVIFFLSFPDFVMIQQNVLCQTQQLVKCCNRKICSL